MAKYTPGPWEVVSLSGSAGPYAIRMAFPSPAASKTYYGVHGVGTIENARLVAEAPELLSIIKDALSGFRCTQRPEHYPADHWSNRALAAIARVELSHV